MNRLRHTGDSHEAATELCEGCVNVRGCVECTELLKANDRVLLTLGTFVHVLSEHSVLCLVFFSVL